MVQTTIQEEGPSNGLDMRYPPKKTDPTQPNPASGGLGWLSHYPRAGRVLIG